MYIALVAGLYVMPETTPTPGPRVKKALGREVLLGQTDVYNE